MINQEGKSYLSFMYIPDCTALMYSSINLTRLCNILMELCCAMRCSATAKQRYRTYKSYEREREREAICKLTRIHQNSEDAQ